MNVSASSLFFIFIILLNFSCKEKCDIGTPDPNCICIEIYEPVCGCDAKTYGNSCQAECAGISDWTAGECK